MLFSKNRGGAFASPTSFNLMYKSGTEVPLFLIIKNSSKQTLSGIIWFFFGLTYV